MVLTVHDIIPLLEAGQSSWTYRMQMKLGLARALRMADQIICISEWTRLSIKNRFPWAASKLLVLPNGRKLKNVDFGPITKSASSITTMSVSRWERYKNWSVLFDGMRLDQRLRLDLVTDLRGISVARQIASDLIESSRLKLHHDLPSAELESLYKACDVYWHPSLFEGYCLPASEALSFGKPVVYCTETAISEVVGPFGIGVERNQPLQHWISAIETAKELCNQEKFRDNLKSHWENLPSWSEIASRLIALYRKMVE